MRYRFYVSRPGVPRPPRGYKEHLHRHILDITRIRRNVHTYRRYWPQKGTPPYDYHQRKE